MAKNYFIPTESAQTQPANRSASSPVTTASGRDVDAGMASLDGVVSKVGEPFELRVVIVSPCFHVVDGVSLTLRKLIRRLRSRGIRVLVATGAPSDGKREAGCVYFPKVKMLGCCKGQKEYSIGLDTGPELESKLEAFRPNLMHITSPDVATIYAIEWARQNGVQVIGTWHSNLMDYMKLWGPLAAVVPLAVRYFIGIYAQCRRTYAPQEALRRRLVRMGFEPKGNGNRVGVWGRGVDVDKFNPAHRDKLLRQRLGYGPDDIVVLWVGRCVTEKRPDIFQQVMWAMYKKGYSNVKGLIIGAGYDYDNMCSVPNCTGIGFQDPSELPKYYASCDILLFPSRVETFGNVTLEGIASGIPAVVADVCSGHLIESGFNGYAVKGLDYVGYEEAVTRLARDEKLRKTMGANGRRLAEEKYGEVFVVDQMIENYFENAKEPPFRPDKLWDHKVIMTLLTYIVKPIYVWIVWFQDLSIVGWVVTCLITFVVVRYGIVGSSDSVSDAAGAGASWLIGVFLATGAQLSGALAKVLMKYVYKLTQRSKQISILIVAYFCMIVLNPVMGLAAYTYAAQSLLAPLSILNLMWNAILATLVLKEKLSRSDLSAYILIITGCCTSSYFGIHTHRDYTYVELMSLFEAGLFKFYILLQVGIAAWMISILRSGEKAHPPWIVRMAYGCLAGMLGGNQFLSKTLSELINSAVHTEGMAAATLNTLVVVGSTVGVMISGIYVLQKGMKYYSAMTLVPIYQGFFTINMAVSGMIFFKEYKLFTMAMAQAYLVAFALISGGMTRLDIPEKISSPETPKEENAGHMA